MSNKEVAEKRTGGAYLKWTAFFGVLFLVNPNISVLDPLPDFIGWMLLIYGIKRILRLEPSASEVVKKAAGLEILSLVRLALTPVIVYIASGDRSFYMLATFVFNIIEPIMAISFFLSMFNGIAAIGYQTDAKSPVKYLNQMKLITVIFFVYKSVLNAIPDMTFFKISDLLDYELYPLARYRLPLTLICGFLCFIAGLIWYAAFCGYLSRLKKEPELALELEKREAMRIDSEKESDDGILKKAFILLLVGMIFLCDLPIDGYNVLPDLVGVILIIISVKMLGRLKVCPNGVGAVIKAAILHGALSTVSLVANGFFAHRYYQGGEKLLPVISGKIALNTLFAAVAFFSCMLLLFTVYRVLGDLIKKNTAALIASGTDELHKMLERSVRIALLLFLFAELFGVLSIALVFRVGWLNFAAVLCCVIGSFKLYSFFGDFKVGFGNKYSDIKKKH